MNPRHIAIIVFVTVATLGCQSLDDTVKSTTTTAPKIRWQHETGG